MTTQPLLQVEDLNVYFKGAQGRFHAVKNLSFAVGREETLALVGESGCGKSTTALAIMQLLAPGASLSGKISLGDDNLLSLAPRDMRKLRDRKSTRLNSSH